MADILNLGEKNKNLKLNYEGAKLNKITNGGHFETEIVG
jgi:hypothetical protein